MSRKRMSICRRVLLSLVFLLDIIALAFADDPVAQLERFYIVNQDDPSTGGCTPAEVTWLNNAYGEAMQMVRGAIRDIDTANGRRSQDNVDDQHQWDKAVSMLTQMFGITPSTGRGVPDPTQSIRLDNARKVFVSLQDQADSPVPSDPRARKVVFCNSNGIMYLGANEPQPGKTNGEPISNLGFPQGALFQPAKFDNNGKLVYGPILCAVNKPVTPGSTPRVQDYFCGSKTLFAVTAPPWNRIFFCPPIFDVQPTTAGANIRLGTRLDELYSGSRIFVHELAHLWHPEITDQIAVDAMMPAPAHPPRLKYLDPRQKVYFFDRCYDLAYNYPDETVETAESFSVFASGQFFGNWRWENQRSSVGQIWRGVAWPMNIAYKGPI